MTAEHRGWVKFNPMTMTYDTPDGTHVAAELAESVQCLADVLQIAAVREAQREDAARTPAKEGEAT